MPRWQSYFGLLRIYKRKNTQGITSLVHEWRFSSVMSFLLFYSKQTDRKLHDYITPLNSPSRNCVKSEPILIASLSPHPLRTHFWHLRTELKIEPLCISLISIKVEFRYLIWMSVSIWDAFNQKMHYQFILLSELIGWCVLWRRYYAVATVVVITVIIAGAAPFKGAMVRDKKYLLIHADGRKCFFLYSYKWCFFSCVVLHLFLKDPNIL